MQTSNEKRIKERAAVLAGAQRPERGEEPRASGGKEPAVQAGLNAQGVRVETKGFAVIALLALTDAAEDQGARVVAAYLELRADCGDALAVLVCLPNGLHGGERDLRRPLAALHAVAMLLRLDAWRGRPGEDAADLGHTNTPAWPTLRTTRQSRFTHCAVTSTKVVLIDPGQIGIQINKPFGLRNFVCLCDAIHAMLISGGRLTWHRVICVRIQIRAEAVRRDLPTAAFAKAKDIFRRNPFRIPPLGNLIAFSASGVRNGLMGPKMSPEQLIGVFAWRLGHGTYGTTRISSKARNTCIAAHKRRL